MPSWSRFRLSLRDSVRAGLIVSGLLVLGAACDLSPTPSPTPTASPFPTDTLTPIDLPTSTATPTPSATPAPTRDPFAVATFPVPDVPYVRHVYGLAWSPDGGTLASGGSGTVVLWDAHSGQRRQTLEECGSRRNPPDLCAVSSLAWSPDGHTLAIADTGHNILFWSPDKGTVSHARWDTESYVVDGMTTFDLEVQDLAWSPDSKVLASAWGPYVYLWKGDTGEILGSFEPFVFSPNDQQVSQIAWSPDGKTLAVTGSQGLMLVAYPLTLEKVGFGNLLAVRGVAWSPDGQVLASTTLSGTISLWEAATRSLLRTIQTDRVVNRLSYSPDGSILAAGETDQVQLFDPQTGQLLLALGAYAVDDATYRLGPWMGLAWSPDGRSLALGGDAKVVLWDRAAMMQGRHVAQALPSPAPTLTPNPSARSSTATLPAATPPQTVPPPPAPLSIYAGDTLSPGFDLGVNTSGGKTDWVMHAGGSICMRYPAGQDWGAVFVTVGTPAPPDQRESRDLSAYQMLSVEMRGTTGGLVLVGVRASTDPDDGSEVKVPVFLDAGWQTYVFPLLAFTEADLGHIYIPIELVFSDTIPPQEVCFRNILYR